MASPRKALSFMWALARLNFMRHKICHGSNLLSAVCSNRVLDAAFLHVRQARLNDNPHSDIWSLALNRRARRDVIREQLLSGRYRLSPITVYRSNQHSYLSRWTAQDAVVLKAIALCISPLIGEQVDVRCYHLKSRGGLKGACRAVRAKLKAYTYVCKSDVAQFYDSMNHDVVMAHLSPVIEDNRILDLVHEYLTRVEIFQGHYRQIECGIPKGCPLSPFDRWVNA